MLTLACSGYLGRAETWEGAIRDFETRDAETPVAADSILFVGSSSIRMWSGLESDMAPLRVVNRGFGGAHLAHVNQFAARIVLPYKPRAVVLYAGDNDLAAGTEKTPESVFADFEEFVRLTAALDPPPPIFFLAIKPSRLRWDRWPVMNDANGRIAALASTDPRLHYIDIASPMLALGEPPPRDLFLFDGLHLSDSGYALWAEVTRSALQAALER
jgi:lysophospholipase L1-like esterase